MFGRTKSHPGELPLTGLPNLPRAAWELARFWVTSERSFVVVGQMEQWSPELLGALLVEGLHTAAAGLAASGAMSETEALQRMWHGLDEERARLESSEPPEGTQ